MDFHIYIDTIRMESPILYFKVLHVEIFILWCTSIPGVHFDLLRTVQNLMKCSIMLHFIRVFTVSQSIRLEFPACADPENFVRGGSNLDKGLFF